MEKLKFQCQNAEERKVDLVKVQKEKLVHLDKNMEHKPIGKRV